MFSQEQKNGIELFVSSERAGVSEPVSSEEVIRSLNINTLHSSLGPFGITEVSAQVSQRVARLRGPFQLKPDALFRLVQMNRVVNQNKLDSKRPSRSIVAIMHSFECAAPMCSLMSRRVKRPPG